MAPASVQPSQQAVEHTASVVDVGVHVVVARRHVDATSVQARTVVHVGVTVVVGCTRVGATLSFEGSQAHRCRPSRTRGGHFHRSRKRSPIRPQLDHRRWRLNSLGFRVLTLTFHVVDRIVVARVVSAEEFMESSMQPVYKQFVLVGRRRRSCPRVLCIRGVSSQSRRRHHRCDVGSAVNVQAWVQDARTVVVGGEAS